MLTVTMSHNSHTCSPPPFPIYSSDLVLPFINYVKHKTIVGNIVYIQFVILTIVINFSCLTTIV